MSEGPSTDRPGGPPPPIAPRPIVFVFASVFSIAMLFNLVFDAYSGEYHGEKITLFLGTATLLILGVDVGKMIGRR
jgi:hypothetical protein